MNADSQQSRGTDVWRNACVLYQAYLALAREAAIEASPCPALENDANLGEEAASSQAQAWFDNMDQQIHVYQLRQFLQTSTNANDDVLKLMLLRHLNKNQHSPADRDKMDFLLVQYFSHAAPSRLQDIDCDLAYVAQAVEPIIGPVNYSIPDWLAPLEQVLESAAACRSLMELFRAKILEQGRKLKASSGEEYFTPVALVAFARFNFLIRRIFFRLMHEEINAILDGLQILQHRDIRMLDCRRAHFSRNEPTDRLRMICHSWKVMFHAEYSSGQPLKILTDLRMVVEEAVARSESGPLPAKAQSRQPAVAATGAKSPEFEIAVAQMQHHED